MAIFTSFASVLNDDGTPMRVRTALQSIDRVVNADTAAGRRTTTKKHEVRVLLFRHFGFQPGP